MITGFLKVVAGLVLGTLGAAVLVSAALWHMLKELDRIDSANDE